MSQRTLIAIRTIFGPQNFLLRKRVVNPGEGVPQIFAKIPGGSRLSGRNRQGGTLFVFKCIFMNQFFENLPRGLPPPPPPPSHPRCSRSFEFCDKKEGKITECRKNCVFSIVLKSLIFIIFLLQSYESKMNIRKRQQQIFLVAIDQLIRDQNGNMS